ncbi:hypothetical protein MKW98_030678 [Papaver atlanticum]|uniref:CXXC motif containing zinc binding protein n=1 Tax=Papaver atlanticum TaxID=357466 RepID=A0AAD4RU02_9MAGN|nr:hypothetical protein MKW98_030678 [Papaver atlanticum]
MVNLVLMITAELDNLTDLQPQGGCDDANFPFYIKIKCGNCGEVSPKETCLVLADTVSIPKSRGTTNLVQKCKFCGREGNITMIPGKGRPLTLEAGETEEYVPLMLFDCRGIEPVEFAFGDGWKVQSTDGTKYEGIDLSSGEFSEYCEKGQVPVMISNLKSKFEILK